VRRTTDGNGTTAVDRGTNRYGLGPDRIRKLDYLSNWLKFLIFFGFVAAASLVVSIIRGQLVITGGALPGVILYVLLVSPIQNRIAKRRRAKSDFFPILRAEMFYSDATKVEVKGRSVTLKGKKIKFRFKVTAKERSEILPFLQQKFDKAVLTIK
jgi:hypothetical protein